MSQTQKSDKKPKSYYVDYSRRTNSHGSKRPHSFRGPVPSNNARYKEVPDIGYGHRGFLITSVDEVKSYLEMKNILVDYYRELYERKDKVDPSEEDLSVEDAIESELKQLRVSRPFKQVKTHCRNTVFINILPDFSHIDPVAIVDRFFDELEDKKQIRTTNTNRVLPILDTCRNSISAVKDSITSILSQHFQGDEEKNYFIELQSRGNYKLESDEKQKMVEGVADTITSLRPSWKVSRDKAHYLVVLVLLKNVCCCTIVEKYFQRSKYNVIEFCKEFPDVRSGE